LHAYRTSSRVWYEREKWPMAEHTQHRMDSALNPSFGEQDQLKYIFGK
jgi:hypothetical protein